ncbi:DNA methyltransferase [Campylobacter fetus]|uniref:DNA methyltransferase n=1 Tax=Campylobacter fetus TaxID=196 RepID=UPI0039C5D99B
MYVKDYIVKDGQTKGEKTKTFIIDKNIINDKAKEHMEILFGRNELFSYPKSEFLMQRIIEISTQENDIVMDFFAGSGTTLAVAMKMNRKFIGIEQMDYIKTITCERLKKVIAGEQGGISKAVGWNGGGNFIYSELMPLNATFKDKIINAKNENELNQIYDELKDKAFLDYRVEFDKFDEEFNKLSLEDKKKNLLLTMDKNMDYVLFDDIEDKNYNIDENCIKINKAFYGQNNG